MKKMRFGTQNMNKPSEEVVKFIILFVLSATAALKHFMVWEEIRPGPGNVQLDSIRFAKIGESATLLISSHKQSRNY